MPIDSPPAASTATTISLREFWAQGADGHSLATLAKLTRVPYSTLYRHLIQKHRISQKNAERVARWSAGRISAAKTLELKS